MREGYLKGVKVLELGLHVAAPACALILERYGASVIKIEQKSGDPWWGTAKWSTKTPMENSPIYDLYNMGKRSIVIDYKDPEGMAVFKELLADADIFLTNVRLKSLKKNGLDPDTIRKEFPRLIYGRVTGYGDKGEMEGIAAFDNVAFWARSGLALDMVDGEAGEAPILSGAGIGDAITGSTLASAVMAALYRREKTGEGEAIEVSLFGAGIFMSGCMSLMAQYGRPFPKKMKDCGLYDIAYPCRDGRYVKMGNKSVSDIPALLEILGVAEELMQRGITTPTECLRGGEMVLPVMKKAFLKKDCEEWLALLQKAGLAAEEALHFRDIPNDAQAIANGYVYPFTLRSGEKCMMPDFPVRADSLEHTPAFAPAPFPGEQTEEILRELGYTEEETQAYREKFL